MSSILKKSETNKLEKIRGEERKTEDWRIGIQEER